jgi:hypothetical protein
VLTAEDLAGMVDTLTDSLPDTCVLSLDVLATDHAGGQSVSSTTTTSVACRMSPLRLTRSSKEAEIVEATRVVEESLWICTLPAGTVVDPRYRITHAGRAFEVVEALAPRSWGLDVRVSTKLLNQGAG